MSQNPFADQLVTTKEFFDRSTACLEESHSDFAPKEGMFTAANHVAHVAQTVDWFMEGAFGDGGFDMDFERLDAEVRKVESLEEARAWLERAFAAAHELLLGMSMDELSEPLPEDGIMGGAPKLAIVSGIDDHTAHHRGALTVYSRLLGLTPAMPYMDT